MVFGIGNPILSDDGAGIFACRMLKEAIDNGGSGSLKNIDIDEGSVSGLGLLDFILGYDLVFLIDAIKTKNGKVGEIYKFSVDDFKDTLHISSPHDVNFATAIEFGKKNSPEEMPKDIFIYAIEVKTVDVFGEKMTPEVRKAVPKLVEIIIGDLKKMEIWH